MILVTGASEHLGANLRLLLEGNRGPPRSSPLRWWKIMMPRALSLLTGSAILLGGLLGTANLLLSTESFPLRFLAAYAFFVTAGALWLWHDFLMSIRRQDRQDDHEREAP
jgi:hypothetical protein